MFLFILGAMMDATLIEIVEAALKTGALLLFPLTIMTATVAACLWIGRRV